MSEGALRINPILCDGHGMCAELFPERIQLDEWGYPIIDPAPLTPELEIGRSVVTATRANDPQPVFELALANHRTVRATANHPFLVLRKDGRARRVAWLPVASILPGDDIAVVGQLPDDGRPHLFDPVERRKRLRSGFGAPETSSDDLLWLLGFYLGDGYFDGPNRVNFAVPDSDPASKY